VCHREVGDPDRKTRRYFAQPAIKILMREKLRDFETACARWATRAIDELLLAEAAPRSGAPPGQGKLLRAIRRLIFDTRSIC